MPTSSRTVRRRATYVILLGFLALGTQAVIRVLVSSQNGAWIEIGPALCLWASGIILTAYFQGAGALGGKTRLSFSQTPGSNQMTLTWEGITPEPDDLLFYQSEGPVFELVFSLAVWVVSILMVEKCLAAMSISHAWGWWVFGVAALAGLGMGLGVRALRRIAIT